MAFSTACYSLPDTFQDTGNHHEDSRGEESAGLSIAVPSDERQPCVAHDQLIEKKYDAFVIHSSADRKWVENLSHNMEGGLRLQLCFAWRDYDKSLSDADNLIYALNNSWLVLIIVTANYCASKSCQRETEEALRCCRNGVIRVILEDSVSTPNLSQIGLWKISLSDMNVREHFFKHLANLMSM